MTLCFVFRDSLSLSLSSLSLSLHHVCREKRKNCEMRHSNEYVKNEILFTFFEYSTCLYDETLLRCYIFSVSRHTYSFIHTAHYIFICFIVTIL